MSEAEETIINVMLEYLSVFLFVIIPTPFI